ncbi:hypothetical protein ACFC0S_00085 [Streptomyces sp. NPDC056084]|uniref:hypothetical protein n=1 Tax=unclassified Streptomyces TaxID=2593676 RepID=UPI0035D76417
MTDSSPGMPGDRLRAIADGFLDLSRALDRSNPVAGLQSLNSLAKPYATARELANTSLFLLLSASSHPLAMDTVEGHYAVESLGHCVRVGTTVTHRIASALQIAAQYHRIDGVNEAAGRLQPRPAQRQDELTAHLQAAVPLAKEGYTRATDAAQALDAAEQRRRREAGQAHAGTSASHDEARTAAIGSPATGLSPAQRGALRMIRRGYARLHENEAGKRRIETGTSTKITMATYESLRGRGLINSESSGRPLYSGRRLLLTHAGEQALVNLESAPSAQPPLPGTPATTSSAANRQVRR